jgi:hypothetical protein
VKRSKKKSLGSNKLLWNFCLNMRNGSEANLILFRFTLKRKKNWSETGAP